jgi:transcriptional regulator with XRE-family HTH domain
MNNELGDELRRLRRARRIDSQEKLAALSGVPLQTIKNIESGRVSESRPSTLMQLARGLAADLEGGTSSSRVEAIYTRLSRAAAHLDPEPPVPADEPRFDREAFQAWVKEETGDEDWTFALSTVAFTPDVLPEDHLNIIKTTIKGLTGEHKAGSNE